MNITLVIPAYNEEKWIGQCLRSVVDNPRNTFAEIIVVDNASTDKTAQIAASFKGVRVVREEKKGTSAARQRGFEEAHTEYIAFTDADCMLPEDWFNKAERLIANYPRAVLWTGGIRYFDGTPFERFILAIGWKVIVRATHFIVGYVGVTGNCVIRRDALQRVGGLDTSITFYGDDTDLAKRLHTIGECVYKSNFTMYSSTRRYSRDGLFRSQFIYSFNYFAIVFRGKPLTKKNHDIR